MLWKLYLDILARIAFNYCDKHIMTTLLSDLEGNCREFTVYNSRKCKNMKRSLIKNVFETALTLSKKLVEYSCKSVDPYFVFDVFNNHK